MLKIAGSIVIPAYNHARYIKDAVSSVLNQSVSVELIVINDGSTDETNEILNQYDGMFYIENRANRGQSDALNYGWSRSNGDILGYLSADDLLEPNAFSAAAEIFIQHPDVVVVYSDFEIINEHGQTIRHVRADDFSLKKMLTEFSCPPGPGAFFRKSALQAAGGWNTSLKRIPDYEFWLRMALQGRFVRVPQVLAKWRVHDGSQAFSSIPYLRAEEPLIAIKGFFERNHLPFSTANLAPQAYGVSYLISAQLHAHSGRWTNALARVIRAFCICPSLFFKLITWRIIFNAFFYRNIFKIYCKLHNYWINKKPIDYIE